MITISTSGSKMANRSNGQIFFLVNLSFLCCDVERGAEMVGTRCAKHRRSDYSTRGWWNTETSVPLLQQPPRVPRDSLAVGDGSQQKSCPHRNHWPTDAAIPNPRAHHRIRPPAATHRAAPAARIRPPDPRPVAVASTGLPTSTGTVPGHQRRGGGRRKNYTTPRRSAKILCRRRRSGGRRANP